MKLKLTRIRMSPSGTIGSLTVDGQFECWTCEDTVRPPGVKIPGSTAIPFGEYRVTITRSARFGRDLPLLEQVPGFSGVRIHPGNTAEDTEGCILVGQDQREDGVGRSRIAFDLLFEKMRAAVRNGEQITLEVTQ